MTSNIPEYNTHAVAERTGIPAATFLAWERRHEVPAPYRTARNQRLYSERDIDQLVWLRDRTAEGMTISQAVAKLPYAAGDHEQPSGGGDNAVESDSDIVVSMAASHDMISETSESIASPSTPGFDQYPDSAISRIVNAFGRYDSRQALAELAGFAAMSPVSMVPDTIIPGVLAAIADRVGSGTLSPVVLRVARESLVRKLGTLFDVINEWSPEGLCVVAGISSETSEIDVMLEAVRVARRGLRVLPLGTDISLADLVDIADVLHPQQITLVASTVGAARNVQTFEDHLNMRRTDHALPRIITAGPAFERRSALALDNGDVSQDLPVMAL